ncbi:hypothetical protein AB0K60_00505 [Thermopolyspora sp. NPDC052614]|uniref:restriction endonuclease subunit S n=1 Tax=Thermopolyspora sp. NPDC052614 TaxID=3155682 RepID=UPI0034223439
MPSDAQGWITAPLKNCLLGIEAGRSPDLPDTPAMPGGWGVLKVSAIHSSGYRPSENKSIQDLTLVSSRHEVSPGDLLFSRANTPELVGSACIATASSERLLLSDKTLRLIVNPELADPRYVCICLSSHQVRQQIVNAASGSSLSMQNISQSSVEGLTLRWPPLVQQRKIVEVVDAVSVRELAVKESIAKLEDIRAGVTAELLESGRDEILEIPVREAGEIRVGKQLSPSSREANERFPYLRVANVLRGWIDYSDVKEMGFTEDERKIYSLRSGDILLNEGQSLELVGRSAIYDGGEGDFYFQNTLIRFRSGGQVLPEYAQMVFEYWLDKGIFAAIAKKTTSIAHLGGERFASLDFPLVSLSRQRYITDGINAILRQKRSLELELAKLGKLRQGIVDDLLSGRVSI